MTFVLPLATCWVLGACLTVLDGRRRWVGVLATVGLVAALAADAALLVELADGGTMEMVTGGWPRGIGIHLRADLVSALFAAVTTLVLTVVLAHELAEEVRSRSFPALILLLGAGLHGVYFTGDIFNFYVFFEISMVASFVLSGYGRGRVELHAAFAFVVVNLAGSVLFLFAVASLYHVTGTLDLEGITARAAPDHPSMLLFAALLLSAFALKLGLFPFHYWVPVVYRDTRPAVAAALAGALANIGTYGVLRLGYGPLQQELGAARVPLLALGATSLLYGTAAALRRRLPEEIVAYTSIAHAGYLFLAFGIGGHAGAVAALLLMISGSLDKATSFLALESRAAGGRLALAVGAASAAGLPLTAGFLGKLELLRAALDEGVGRAALVATLLVAGALAIGASFRVVQLDRAPEPSTLTPKPAVVLLLAVVAVAMGVVPGPLLRLVHVAVRTLPGGTG